jgi:hypothetical protein
MPKYAKRVDVNHADIRAAFRGLLGDENVVDTSKAGYGLGDLVVTLGGIVMLIEIKKEGGKPKFTKAQKDCKLPQRLVRNRADVEETVRVLKQWHGWIVAGALRQDPLVDYPDNSRTLG